MTLNPNAFLDGVMNGFSLHIEPPSYSTYICEKQLKGSKKTHQVEVIELFLAKLALPKGLKNFPIQLFNPLSDSSCKDFAICYHSGNDTITL